MIREKGRDDKRLETQQKQNEELLQYKVELEVKID
jgi:hypothetical protein